MWPLWNDDPPPSETTLSLLPRQGIDVPIVARSDAYLAHRDRWICDALNRSLDRNDTDFVAPVSFSLRVHREPFTSGEWLGSLTPAQNDYRQTSESQTLELLLRVAVTGVPTEHLLLFLIFDDFRDELHSPGVMQREVFVPPIKGPLPSLEESPPALAANQFLALERMNREETLAKPTAAYYLYAFERVGTRLVLRFDVWRDIGTNGYAKLHLSTGQYVIHPTPNGARLDLFVYYCGQTMPTLFDLVVKMQTETFFKNMATAIREQVASWEPSTSAKMWLAKAQVDSGKE